jgi:hypothetical protein
MPNTIFRGHLRKMAHNLDSNSLVNYQLKLYEPQYASRLQDKCETNPEDYRILEDLNQYLGKKIKLEYQDQINCISCGRKTNKSFNQGYCFPCLNSLAECDSCIIKPELCHFDRGTCRDSEFGESNCNIEHSIYLSLTSSLKIGITRQHQEATRWVDQGAVKALRILTVKRRWHAGLIEAELAKDMADKTNWRKMLKNEYENLDLIEEKKILLEKIKNIIELAYLDDDLSYIIDEKLISKDYAKDAQEIKYPVLEYPKKLNSFNLDKNPIVEGTLEGIKGQYLLLDTGVINLRKYAGYLVEFLA